MTGERWTTQNTVVITALPGAFRSMTDVQLFCNEEIKKAHSKFSATLSRTIAMVAPKVDSDSDRAVSQEQLDEGAKQLDNLNKIIDHRLQQLRDQKEQEAKQQRQQQQEKLEAALAEQQQHAEAQQKSQAKAKNRKGADGKASQVQPQAAKGIAAAAAKD